MNPITIQNTNQQITYPKNCTILKDRYFSCLSKNPETLKCLSPYYSLKSCHKLLKEKNNR